MSSRVAGRILRRTTAPQGLVAACLVAALPFMWSLTASGRDSQESPIRIGFSRAVFKGVNENDILASLRVWAGAIRTERGLNVNPNVRVFDSTRELVEGVRSQQVEGLAVMLDEYAAFPAGLVSGPYYRPEINGTTLEQFVVLARRDSRITTLAGLRGSTLLVHDSVHKTLSTAWLLSRLRAEGLGGVNDHFSAVEESPKLSAAVLGVYFGSRDACLVTREGFDSVASLNPQVAKQLVVIATSPPVVPAIFCFRADTQEDDKAMTFREITHLHESVAGEQVLRVFKADRMSEVTSEQLERSLELLEQWQSAARGRPAGPAENGGRRTEGGS